MRQGRAPSSTAERTKVDGWPQLRCFGRQMRQKMLLGFQVHLKLLALHADSPLQRGYNARCAAVEVGGKTSGTHGDELGGPVKRVVDAGQSLISCDTLLLMERG